LKPQVAELARVATFLASAGVALVKEHIIATVIVYDETESLVEIVGF